MPLITYLRLSCLKTNFTTITRSCVLSLFSYFSNISVIFVTKVRIFLAVRFLLQAGLAAHKHMQCLGTHLISSQMGCVDDSDIIFIPRKNRFFSTDILLFEWEKLSTTMSHEKTTSSNYLFWYCNMRSLFPRLEAAISSILYSPIGIRWCCPGIQVSHLVCFCHS